MHKISNFSGRAPLGIHLKRRKVDQGFSILIALVAFLVLVVGSIALASRTTSGLFGVVAQAKNREARDVAESGIIEIINELNKEPNRKALVSGNSTYPWASGDPRLINACTGITSSGGTGPTTNPDPRLFNLASGWVNLVPGNTQKQFRLDPDVNRPVEYRAVDRSLLSLLTPEIAEGAQKSLIRIAVIGRVMQNGVEVSRARVTREFEVVPKCCKRSFPANTLAGMNYGSDARACFPDGRGGNGFIVGLNGGSVVGRSGALDIINDLNNPVTQAICWGGGTLDPSPTPDAGPSDPCIDGELRIGSPSPTRTGTSFLPVDFDLELPEFYCPPDEDCDWNVLTVTSGSRYIRVDEGIVKICNSSGTGCVPLLPNSCHLRLPIAASLQDQIYNCRLSRISSSNQDLIVDTSNGQIYLFFDDSSATSATKYLDLGGNGTIRHVQCSYPSTSSCTTNASLANSSRFSVFAFSTGLGEFELRGTTDIVMDIIAPYATVDFRGNSTYLGRIWTNSVDLNGNVTLKVPRSQPDFCEDEEDDCPPQVGSLVDYLARSYTHASGF